MYKQKQNNEKKICYVKLTDQLLFKTKTNGLTHNIQMMKLDSINVISGENKIVAFNIRTAHTQKLWPFCLCRNVLMLPAIVQQIL